MHGRSPSRALPRETLTYVSQQGSVSRFGQSRGKVDGGCALAYPPLKLARQSVSAVGTVRPPFAT